MKFMKLMVVTLAVALSAASAGYSAVAFSSASTLNMMAPNARNGWAGEVALWAVSSGTVPVDEILIISYEGAQISVLSSICVKATIVSGVQLGFGATAACTAADVPYPGIVSAAGFTGYGVPLTQPGIMSVTVNQTNIAISFLTGVPFTVNYDGFEISGVRLNVAPLTGGTTTYYTVNAIITSVQSQISTTNPIMPVAITQDPLSILSGTVKAQFSSDAVGIGPTVIVPGPPGSVSTTITANEGAALPNAFATNGAAAPTQVIFKIAGIPAGIHITGAAIAAAPSGYTRVGSTSGSMANGVVVGPTTPTAGFTQIGSTATVTVYILSSDPSLIEVAPVTITFTATTTTLPVGAIGTATATLGPEVAGASGVTLTLPAAGLAFGTAGPVAYQAQYEPTVNIIEIIGQPPGCEVNINLSWTGVLNAYITFGTSQPANFNLYLGIMNYSIPLISAVPVPVIQPSTSVSIPLSIPSYGKVVVLATFVTSEGIICSDWKTIDTKTP